MLLVGGAAAAPLRVALVTTHLALKDVPAAITRDAVAATVAHRRRRAARAKFGIAAPRIAVCGLNPHAGEGGHLGREEIDVIAPAIAALARRRASTPAARCRRTPCSCPSTRAPSTRSSRCTTTRACRC